MKIETYIQRIQTHLIQTHSELFDWYELDDEIKNFRPADEGWTITEILEHVSLTSHYLLILIDKGTSKALRNVGNLNIKEELQQFKFELNTLLKIGNHKSFEWIRPEHMEPTGKLSDLEVRLKLSDQLNRCLTHLCKMMKGEGLLYKTTMTVNDLGKINVYEYIYFLSLHAKRHISQMQENLDESRLAKA